MDYPYIEPNIGEDELIEHFILEQEDWDLIDGIRKDKNCIGFVILFKTFLHLGYPPHRKTDIPLCIVKWIAEQIGFEPELFQYYEWRGSVWKSHLSLIREHTGFRPLGVDDHNALVEWLSTRGNDFTSRKELCAAAIRRCRECKLELPKESEFRRLVHSARKKFFVSLYQSVAERIDHKTKELLDRLIEPSDLDISHYEWFKLPPGPPGKNTLLDELKKLKYVREFGIDQTTCFCGYSSRILKRLRDRVRPEDAFQIRRHPSAIRYTLLAALIAVRVMEITDTIVRLFLKLTRRIEKRSGKTLEKSLMSDLDERVYGKSRILYRVARVAIETPDSTFREVLFPVVKENVFQRLIQEYEKAETSYDASLTNVMRKKYTSSYRSVMKTLFHTLVFRSNNPSHRPLLKGIELMRRYLDTRHIYYPQEEEIPEELFTGSWKEVILEKSDHGPRARKHYFELCILRKLERTLKSKEVWVEGAYRFRNPDEDLPSDWEDRRIEYYQERGLPLCADEFIAPIKDKLYSSLDDFNRFLTRKQDVFISHPRGGERGIFNVPKIEKRPERPLIQKIKQDVISQWGIQDLLDIFLEADRRVHFSRFFRSSGTRQVLTKQEIRERLLLVIFSLGTNMGLSRIHSAAKPTCSCDDLRYFRDRFITVESLRQAITALTNRILEIRNPAIWGRGTACASDGKYLSAWDQNLIAEWNPHYGKRGVLVYWHVDKSATCIYSQLVTHRSSEIAAMIEGLVRHDTEMRVESNFADSHGQSEVAFAFCRMLGFELLPRLKRIKFERLYFPEGGNKEQFPTLSGVISRPIRWDHVHEQYDEMIRHVVAVAEGTGPTDSILRRFNSYNRTHPTYKAFTELGKALKTIFLCRYLSRSDLRHEIHEALNIIENWNSCIDFIFYGRKSEIQTNDPNIQEIVVLCLHLLQNALILVNTIMVERIMSNNGYLDRMKSEDFRALTPLFTSNVNPYGDFELDLNKPSFLEVR